MKIIRKIAILLSLASFWLLCINSVYAHHSTVEFDYSQSFSVKGTIKEFQWTNPHAWVQVLVPNEAGELIEYGFELGAPIFNARMGWRKNSLKAGDDVMVLFCPNKDGRPRGTLMQIFLSDGSVLSGIGNNFFTGKRFDDPEDYPTAPAPTKALK